MSSQGGTGAAALARIRDEADQALVGIEEGDALDHPTRALIRLGVRCSVASFDRAAVDREIRSAVDGGATPDQVHEVLVLVSGLGVHTLMEGSRVLAQVMAERGERLDGPLDRTRSELRDRWQGDGTYWAHFEQEVPGFLDALLRLSPEAYEAFFVYCAVPWRTRAVPAMCKELISMAADASPHHTYAPGMRLHLANAVRLGASRRMITDALDLAADG